MDTLEKLNTTPNTAVPPTDTDRLKDMIAKTEDEVTERVDDAVEDVKEAAQKINWRTVAGYAAAGIAVVGAAGAYAYWQAQQRKPKTRLQRLKSQLGLSDVDFHHLRSTIDRFDAEQLDKSRRKLGHYAKKATHAGARKIAELTR